mgnify:CR=1 FL=1
MDTSQRQAEASAVAERILYAAQQLQARMANEAPVPLARMRELSMEEYTRLMNESGATFDDAARALEACGGDLVDTILELTSTQNNCPDVLRVRAQRRERLRRAGSGMVHVIERTRRLFPVTEPEPEPLPEPAPMPAPEAEAELPAAEPDTFQSFTAADGSTWTHTSERGWSRQAAEEEPSVEEREAINEQTDMLEAWVLAQQARDSELLHQRGRLNADWRNGPVHVRNRIRFLMHETLIAHAEREAILGRQVGLHEPWADVYRAVRSWDGLATSDADLRRAIDRVSEEESLSTASTMITVGRQFYVDEVFETASESDPEASPPAARLASESSDSSSEDEAGGVRRDPYRPSRGGGYGGGYGPRISPHVIYAGQCPGAPAWPDAIKKQLRAVQELLDAELAAAAQGTVFSEGSYLSIMASIKKAWEAVDAARVTRV